MKKTKLITSILALCCSILALSFGVYAAVKQVDYTVSGTLSYEVTDVYVSVSTKVYGYNSDELMYGKDGLRILEEIEDITPDSADWPEELVELDSFGEYNSLTSTGSSTYSDLELEYGKENNQSYAYFLVVNIQNLSEAPAYAVVTQTTDALSSWNVNSAGQVNITSSASKNVVFALGLEDPLSSFSGSQLNYTVQIGNFSETSGLTYSDNDDGTVSVTGISNTTTDTIVIPNTNSAGKTVTAITALASETEYKNLIIGDNVTSIGGVSIASLKNVVFSRVNDVTFVENTFKGCSSIEYFRIPSNIITFASNSFAGCTSLKQMVLPFAGVTPNADSWMTANISVMFNYSFPSTLNALYINGTKIPDNFLQGYSITANFYISDTVEYIGESAFSHIQCNSIVLPKNLSVIENSAFVGANVSTVIFQNEANTTLQIGWYAFSSVTTAIAILATGTTWSDGANTYTNSTALLNLFSTTSGETKTWTITTTA